MSLQELKNSILKDGKIDYQEVKEIRNTIFKDGKIDVEEAEFIFDLNTACSDAANDPSWQQLLIDAISSYLLDDEISPNSIDTKEAKWLISKIGEDGHIDDNEKALLLYIKNKAQSMPSSLSEYINMYAKN
jgi:hypothetical protein